PRHPPFPYTTLFRSRAEGHGRSEGGEDGEGPRSGRKVLGVDVGAEVDPPPPGCVDLRHHLEHLVALVGVELEEDWGAGHGAVVARSGPQRATAGDSPRVRPEASLARTATKAPAD